MFPAVRTNCDVEKGLEKVGVAGSGDEMWKLLEKVRKEMDSPPVPLQRNVVLLSLNCGPWDPCWIFNLQTAGAESSVSKSRGLWSSATAVMEAATNDPPHTCGTRDSRRRGASTVAYLAGAVVLGSRHALQSGENHH